MRPASRSGAASAAAGAPGGSSFGSKRLPSTRSRGSLVPTGAKGAASGAAAAAALAPAPAPAPATPRQDAKESDEAVTIPCERTNRIVACTPADAALTPLLCPSNANRTHVLSIAIGKRVTLVVDAAGQVICWPTSTLLAADGVVLANLPPAVQVAATDHSSLVLDRRGSLWSWGHNPHGVLGLGLAAAASATSPTRIVKAKQDSTVIDAPVWCSIAAGPAHCCAIDVAGRVFSWGFGSSGQLGHCVAADEPRPRLITVLSDVPCKQACCGAAHTVALSWADRVYVWGSGTHGALGLNDKQNRNTPHLVESLRTLPVSWIAAGPHVSCAVGPQLYVWGAVPAGSFGLSASTAMVPLSVELPDTGAPHAISCCESAFLLSSSTGNHWLVGGATLPLLSSANPLFQCGENVAIMAAGCANHLLTLPLACAAHGFGSVRAFPHHPTSFVVHTAVKPFQPKSVGGDIVFVDGEPKLDAAQVLDLHDGRYLVVCTPSSLPTTLHVSIRGQPIGNSPLVVRPVAPEVHAAFCTLECDTLPVRGVARAQYHEMELFVRSVLGKPVTSFHPITLTARLVKDREGAKPVEFTQSLSELRPMRERELADHTKPSVTVCAVYGNVVKIGVLAMWMGEYRIEVLVNGHFVQNGLRHIEFEPGCASTRSCLVYDQRVPEATVDAACDMSVLETKHAEPVTGRYRVETQVVGTHRVSMQFRDEFGNPGIRGGDSMRVRIIGPRHISAYCSTVPLGVTGTPRPRKTALAIPSSGRAPAPEPLPPPVPEDLSDLVSMTMSDNDDGTYSLVLRSLVAGDFYLEGLVGGQPIVGPTVVLQLLPGKGLVKFATAFPLSTWDSASRGPGVVRVTPPASATEAAKRPRPNTHTPAQPKKDTSLWGVTTPPADVDLTRYGWVQLETHDSWGNTITPTAVHLCSSSPAELQRLPDGFAVWAEGDGVQADHVAVVRSNIIKFPWGASPMKGPTLHVLYDGQHIPGSPFTVPLPTTLVRRVGGGYDVQ